MEITGILSHTFLAKVTVYILLIGYKRVNLTKEIFGGEREFLVFFSKDVINLVAVFTKYFLEEKEFLIFP